MLDPAAMPKWVRKRLVLYCPGYDPMAGTRYRRLIGTGLAQLRRRFGIARNIGPLQRDDAVPSIRWGISAGKASWHTETDYEVLLWDDLVHRDFSRGWLVRLPLLFGALIEARRGGDPRHRRRGSADHRPQHWHDGGGRGRRARPHARPRARAPWSGIGATDDRLVPAGRRFCAHRRPVAPAYRPARDGSLAAVGRISGAAGCLECVWLRSRPRSRPGSRWRGANQSDHPVGALQGNDPAVDLPQDAVEFLPRAFPFPDAERDPRRVRLSDDRLRPGIARRSHRRS